MRTRSRLPPMLTWGIMRSVWLLKAAPSPGAGAAVQVPTQCMVFVAIDASSLEPRIGRRGPPRDGPRRAPRRVLCYAEFQRWRSCMAESQALGQFKKLTLDALQVGEEFVSDDHLVI